MKIWLAALLIIAGLAGCEFFSPRSEQAPGQAEVVIYRPGRLIAFTRNYTLELDGRAVAELANGSFIRVHVQPGAHGFGITDELAATWSGSLAPDTRYYLQLEISGAAPKFEVALRQVEPEVAAAELQDLRELQ